MTKEANNSGNNKQGKIARLPGQRLTKEDRLGILLDFAEGKSWNQIVEERGVSKSTISAVRKKALEDGELLKELKSLRLGRLYTVSEKFLEALDGRGLEGESTRDLAVAYGILQDKIQKEEGLIGNVNIAVGTFQRWGFGQEPTKDDKQLVNP